ncbi:MAG: phosphoglycerate mutase family protein [Proteobacteria bacterium]|nr:phosphoglycerate mutase family protein [Pseudomonadota bacterium]
MDITLYLVRHGEAAGAWDETADPGLSTLGHQQAESLAEQLHAEISPLPIYSSPLMRTRETSSPLERLWSRQAEVVPRLSEVPSTGIDFKDRRKWLTTVLQRSWPEQTDFLQEWRAGLVDYARNMDHSAVFITHFVVINSLVGAAEKSDQVLVFRPDHCSVTKIKVSSGELSLIEKGSEAVTVVK